MLATINERTDSFARVLGTRRGLTPAQRAEVAATPPAATEADEDVPVANADGSYTEGGLNGCIVTSFYLDGRPRHMMSQLHRDDGPAQVVVDHGGVRREWWYERGVHHRENGPAVTMTFPDGSHSETYYVHGKLHREDGPALTVVEASGLGSMTVSEEYYEHGRLHRVAGPAAITTFPDGKCTRYWYYHGRRRSSHRLLRALSGRNGYRNGPRRSAGTARAVAS
jgi:hypothetical protein